MAESKYKEAYRALKGKLHSLIYENECFKLALRKNQKLMLRVTRDRSFLLDKLLEQEKVEHSTSETDSESTSEEEVAQTEPASKKRKLVKRPTKRQIVGSKNQQNQAQSGKNSKNQGQNVTFSESKSNADGHMTPEEVERHLQSQSFLDLVPERPPLTVPTEMFSHEPSLDSESNDMIGEMMETSPSNVGEEIIIDNIL